MHVIIARVDEILFEGDAQSLIAPGSAGQLTVLSHHMPLVTTLTEGELIVRPSSAEGFGEAKKFKIDSGVLEVRHDGATVIL